MKRTLAIIFWCVVALVGVPIVAAVIYTIVPKQNATDKTDGDSDVKIASASASELEPTGELADMFSVFSNATQLQRDEKERQIKGTIVRWRLPVYDVSERGGLYVIQTKSRRGAVGAFCYVKASDEIKKYVLALKENDLITCKGRIAGTSMRSIEIRPAVLQ